MAISVLSIHSGTLGELFKLGTEKNVVYEKDSTHFGWNGPAREYHSTIWKQ